MSVNHHLIYAMCPQQPPPYPPTPSVSSALAAAHFPHAFPPLPADQTDGQKFDAREYTIRGSKTQFKRFQLAELVLE